jgi:hypothetical protein
VRVTDLVQVVAIVVSACLLVAVVDLVRRRRLREEYAFVWLVWALLLLALAVWRNSLELAAHWLGVYYPPAVLLLAVILAVFVVSLYFSVVISQQRQQIESLVETLALLEAEIRASRSIASAHVIAHTTGERDEAAGERHVG